MRGVQVVNNWKPTVGDTFATNQSAAILGAGVQWSELNAAAYMARKIVVSGAQPVSNLSIA